MVELGQPEHAPCISSSTIPVFSLKLWKVISPPSCATAGRMRVSISSFNCFTSSESSSDALLLWLEFALFSSSNTGFSATKCSIIVVRIWAFRLFQSVRSDLVTVIKSLPKKIEVTPLISNKLSAKGEMADSFLELKVAVPFSSTDTPGMNFNVLGLGVFSVWMNIMYLIYLKVISLGIYYRELLCKYNS